MPYLKSKVCVIYHLIEVHSFIHVWFNIYSNWMHGVKLIPSKYIESVNRSPQVVRLSEAIQYGQLPIFYYLAISYFHLFAIAVRLYIHLFGIQCLIGETLRSLKLKYWILISISLLYKKQTYFYFENVFVDVNPISILNPIVFLKLFDLFLFEILLADFIE